MWSNKPDYSTVAGVYYTTHDFEVPLFMSDFLISKIINHCIHVNNGKFDSGIDYDMIIGRDMMV